MPNQPRYPLGLIPQPQDDKDFRYALRVAPAELPKKVDLSATLPGVFDQGNLGSCVANSAAAGYMALRYSQHKPAFVVSRLFIYYNARLIDGDVHSDSGTTLRAGVKAMSKKGVTDELLWPYQMADANNKPNDRAYRDAADHLVTKYEAVENTVYGLKHALADGHTVHIGIQVYSGMWKVTAKKPRLSLPRIGEASQGGHALLAYGYDDAKKVFLIRNSWGEKWGLNGNFYLPYTYLDGKRAFDFWTITDVM